MDKNRRTILLTEDEALIGFDLQDALVAAGYGIAGPAGSCAEALSWLKDNEPDVAILDVMLRDGPCTTIARELQRRGIPFLVYSGDRQQEAAPELRNVRWLEKPAAHQELLKALSQVLGPAGD
ncbi:MAG TPA: response regulator [Microvirga sp.]|nr:response regulator [Microvirga sp.]